MPFFANPLNAVYQQKTKTITANYTLTAADNGYVILINATSNITITLPQQSTAVLNNAYYVNFRNIGVSDVTVIKQGVDILLMTNTLIGPGDSALVQLVNAATPNTWIGEGGTPMIPVEYRFFIPSILPGPFPIMQLLYASFALPQQTTFTDCYFVCNAGTATMNWIVGSFGAPVMTGGACAVSTTETYQAITGNNVGQSGQTLLLGFATGQSATTILISIRGFQRGIIS